MESCDTKNCTTLRQLDTGVSKPFLTPILWMAGNQHVPFFFHDFVIHLRSWIQGSENCRSDNPNHFPFQWVAWRRIELVPHTLNPLLLKFVGRLQLLLLLQRTRRDCSPRYRMPCTTDICCTCCCRGELSGRDVRTRVSFVKTNHNLKKHNCRPQFIVRHDFI